MSLWGSDCPLPALAACNQRGMVCSRLALYSALFCEQAWWCLAAAESLQLSPTLCDPIDGSPPGSPVPATQFSGCTTSAPSQADVDCPEPQEVLAKKPAYSLVDNVSLGLRLPPSGSGCLSPEGDGLQPAICSVFCSVRGPGGVLG